MHILDFDQFGVNVTFHGIQFPREYFIIDVSLVPLGHMDVVCSVVMGFSCDMFAGFLARPLPRASLRTRFAHSSPVVEM